jgi:hypothetical protein
MQKVRRLRCSVFGQQQAGVIDAQFEVIGKARQTSFSDFDHAIVRSP